MSAGTFKALQSATTVGQELATEWPGAYEEYLKVLPVTNVNIQSGWMDWQKSNKKHEQGIYKTTNKKGTFYSSWGPSDVLDIDLSLAPGDRTFIEGFGEIRSRKEFSSSIYDNEFWFYNGGTPGPVIVADPGDTIRVKLTNNLVTDPQTYEWNDTVNDTNLHLHGAHTPAEGDGDNVMIAIEQGDSHTYTYEIPENHPSGLLWMHPHYHGATSVSLAGGAALPVLILPDENDAPNLKKYDPTKENIHILALQAWAVEQQENPTVEPTDNNWEATKQMPPRLFSDSTGNYYKYASAPFNGNNYEPLEFFKDFSNEYVTFESTYGDYVAATTTENLIHTVNSQYNPTIQATTGEWNTFAFFNFSLNASHAIQLIRVDDNGDLHLESPNLLGMDSDISRWASPFNTEVTTLPDLSPGGRVTIQHAFTKPGEYYFLTNGTEEVIGELGSPESNRPKNADENYLGFHDGFQVTPSQVLATVQVDGEVISKKPDQPEAWSNLEKDRKHAIGLRKEAKKDGVLRERTFNWKTNTSNIAGTDSRTTKEGPDGEYSDPGYNAPEDWEGVWTINQQYWSHEPTLQPTLTIAMLDSLEQWNLVNSSESDVRTQWPEDDKEIQIQIGQSHPFHLHQNEFVIKSINGLKVSGNTKKNQVGDAIIGDSAIDVFQMGPAYVSDSATSENPYGSPMLVDSEGNKIYADGSLADDDDDYLTDFKAEMLVRFEDYTGLFVDHCHLLFHEDGGMMASVLVVLNTNDSWISDTQDGNVVLSRASDYEKAISFLPFNGQDVIAATGDINSGSGFTPGPQSRTVNSSDNIADLAVIPSTANVEDGKVDFKVYNGKSIKKISKDSGNTDSDSTTLPNQIQQGTVELDKKAGKGLVKTSIQTGDIDGDGHDEIIIGISGKNYASTIEVIDGKTFKHLYSLNPFADQRSESIDLGIGDVNGDNYADIIVSQGKGGTGLVEGFNGKLLTEHSTDKKENLTDCCRLWTDSFQPHGNHTKGVKLAVGYSLPDEQYPYDDTYTYEENSHNQTYLANLTTLAVNKKSDDAITHWLVNSGSAHSGHGDSSMDDMEMSSMDDMDMNSSQPDEIIENGKIATSAKVSDIQFQYMDYPGQERGQGTLMLNYKSGMNTLMHLTASTDSSTDDFTTEEYVWAPNTTSMG